MNSQYPYSKAIIKKSVKTLNQTLLSIQSCLTTMTSATKNKTKKLIGVQISVKSHQGM